MLSSYAAATRQWLDAQALRLQAWSGYSRRGLLLFACACGALNSILVFLMPHFDDTLHFNFYAFFIFSALFLVVYFGNAVIFASHILVIFSAALLSLIVFHSGGINSPNIAWLPVVPVAALMLISVRWSLIWLFLIVVLNLFQFTAVELQWINGRVSLDIFSLDQVILSKLNVVIFLIVAIALYDWMRNAKLRDVSARNADLLQTHQALRDAQAYRDEFIAAVGHELRTPMNAILGLNSVLVSELSSNTEQAAIAIHIRQATEHLLRVVNDILDISQLEAGRLILQPTVFAFEASLRDGLSRFQSRAQDKGIDLSLYIDPSLPHLVCLDKHRFHQVLNHLLDNAVKFTQQGGIKVCCLSTAMGLRIEVADTGTGIDPAINQAIFNRFSLASEGIQRMYGGAGLGLSLSDRLVSLMGGQMGLISPPQGGSKFWFELPLTSELPMPIETAHLLAELNPSPYVLVVDDTPVNLMVVEILLNNLWPNAVVHKVDNGEKALKACQSTSFTLVLMDVVMPVMDGLETTRRLLDSTFVCSGSKPFVIGLTAHN